MFLLSPKPTLTKRDQYMLPLIPAALVFLALMAIVGFSWNTANLDIQKQRAKAVNENSSHIRSVLLQRFKNYEDSLRAATALYGASDTVTRSEWRSFVDTLDIAERYPGIRGMGYIEVADNVRKLEIESEARNDGLNSYTVYPAGERDVYAPVVYFVLFDKSATEERTNSLLGYDSYSDSTRRSAMEKAARTGSAVLSNPVVIKQAPDSKPNGFILYIPHYKIGMPTSTEAERLAAIDGYFYAPFLMLDIFRQLFSDINPDFGLALSDADPEPTLLYETENSQHQDMIEQKREQISLHHQEWTLLYKIKPTIVAEAINQRPMGVITGGLVFSLALASSIYLLIQRRTRSIADKEESKLESAKDELLSLASHQLRTPATAVKQYVSMVRDGYAGSVSKDQKELLDMAYESNERQLTIVNDLLYVARIDAGNTTLRMERFNLTELLRSVIKDQDSQLKSKNQKVILKNGAKNVWLVGDPRYIRMIFENLLSNASKYSYENKSIVIQIKNSAQSVVVTVTDRGVGIVPEEYKNVFQKFSRIPNELTRQTAGSGIGLYLSKRLANLHNGDITFVSVPKKGSSFSVMLPKKQDDMPNK